MNNKTNNLKVAIVTEELTQLGGAERVLDCLIEMFPSAPIYTIVWDDKKTRGKYRNKDIRPSFIQKMPFGVKKYKWYLLLMPAAIEFFNLKNYDLVLSVTSALAKGVKTSNKQIHICYCNTPTRYLWFDSADYIKNAPIPKFIRPLMPAVLWFLRRWDLKASRRPNYFIANSENVRRRIKKYYNRESTPIFPPVDVTNFRPYSQVRPARSGNYYLLVSRLEPYKKVDLVIRAFQKLRLPLKIVGSGSQLTQYINSIQSETIEFVGRVDDSELAKYYQNAIATIFPQEEDAGIVPLESMACGRPVIAYAKGGAREAIVDGKTGILFNRQNISALEGAVKKSRQIKFDEQIIRQHAEKFDKTLFKKKVLEYIIDKLQR